MLVIKFNEKYFDTSSFIHYNNSSVNGNSQTVGWSVKILIEILSGATG